MRVISKSRLKKFWESPNCGDSEGPLRAWYTRVNDKSVVWENWGDVTTAYGNADLVGRCVVFNIAGNKFRLITRILYPRMVYILKVMTHKEYDNGNWKVECKCFSPSPKKAKKKAVAKLPKTGKRKRKGK